jgi:hypothetical protein
MLPLASDLLSPHGLLFWIILFVVYWFPTFLAFLRNIRKKATVILLNIFGLLVIPWLLALIYAATSTKFETTPPPSVG